MNIGNYYLYNNLENSQPKQNESFREK